MQFRKQRVGLSFFLKIINGGERQADVGIDQFLAAGSSNVFVLT